MRPTFEAMLRGLLANLNKVLTRSVLGVGGEQGTGRDGGRILPLGRPQVTRPMIRFDLMVKLKFSVAGQKFEILFDFTGF